MLGWAVNKHVTNPKHLFQCFFIGGNNSEAVIMQDDVVVSENGRYVPDIVDRSLDGDYTCQLGESMHIIHISVFASEDEL